VLVALMYLITVLKHTLRNKRRNLLDKKALVTA
jgi:hypothetical protein